MQKAVNKGGEAHGVRRDRSDCEGGREESVGIVQSRGIWGIELQLRSLTAHYNSKANCSDIKDF